MNKRLTDAEMEAEIKWIIHCFHFNNTRSILTDYHTGRYLIKSNAKRVQGDAIPRKRAKQLIQYFECHKARLQRESQEAIAKLVATGYRED